MAIRRNQFIILLLCTALFTIIIACNKKDKVDTNPSLTLSFSTDTVFFDTVFTTIGSVTQKLLVYNNNDNKVMVSSIRLAGGSQSFYKINIDGTPATSISDVEIPGHDSLFIFIRITIDPNNQNNPLVVSDSILFMTNGNFQDVNLMAWGQDANFYKEKTLEGNIVWDSLKPHVIYGFVRVDTAASLTILAGTKVYLHKNAYLAVSKEATLKLAGTLDHPVRFQGDRMDPFYRDLPGQWNGIYLENGSKQNEIDYAIIKNGSYGISIDSISSPTEPALKINNTIIQNMTGTGLSAYASNVVSTNCVIGGCGSASLELSFGGSYDFRQLTIGNYWGGSVRLSPALYISNYIYDDIGTKIPNPLTKAYFGNCILYGNLDEEIMLDSDEITQFNYIFDHGLLRTETPVSDPVHYTECIVNEDPVFVDVVNNNYAIDSISPAIQKGIPMGVPVDINGVERIDPPDLGAYQYVKKN
jgi:hypothetical protein